MKNKELSQLKKEARRLFSSESKVETAEGRGMLRIIELVEEIYNKDFLGEIISDDQLEKMVSHLPNVREKNLAIAGIKISEFCTNLCNKKGITLEEFNLILSRMKVISGAGSLERNSNLSHKNSIN